MSASWEELLKKHNRELQIFFSREYSPDEKEDVDFVNQLLDLTLKSGNGQIDLYRAGLISPDSFSFFVNRYFSIKYSKAAFAYENSGQIRKLKWLTQEKIAEENPYLVNLHRIWAPRWNVFARLAMLNVTVSKSLEIDLDTVWPHSDAFTAVIYSGQKTIASVGSWEGLKKNTFDLEAGDYKVVYRFYSNNGSLYCPRVIVDQDKVVKDEVYPVRHYQEMINQLKVQRSPAYFWQQYYVFKLLKERKKQQEAVLTHEFIPVPNPDTSYDYEWLGKGSYLAITAASACLEHYRIYILYLNEQSLPIYSVQMNEKSFSTSKIEEDGAYFIRFVPRGNHYEGFPKPQYRCSIIEAGD